jgi:phosphoribosyl-ATP pyrophosphohydrolase/phosphoribosyl-AMP cyclohydrolase
MIIPSIDLVDGNAVQLVHGKKLKINAGNPKPIAKQFALSGSQKCRLITPSIGKLAIIDIDAAKHGKSTHKQLICDLIKLVHNEHANCKVHVGGGIRDVQTALDWLDHGADRIIIGTAAKVELLKKLPKDRVIVALDGVDGKVVVHGWQVKTGEHIFDKIRELAPYVYGFLVTFVEVEGTMKGFNFSKVKQLAEFVSQISPDTKLIYAGGITTCEHVRLCDEIGVDVQVGMALYSGALKLSDAILAPVKVSENGLIPTVVVDENGECLGLVYSNHESVSEAVKTRKGVYFSRKRGLWVKGNESGNTQELLRIEVDCDRDALRFIVRQHGRGFCHLKDRSSCFGDDEMRISKLFKIVESRAQQAPEESYTKKLLSSSSLLDSKIIEEANELVDASSPQEVIHEAADVLYFTIVKCVSKGVSLKDLQNELLSRSLRVTRRPGYAKKFSATNDPKIRLGIPKGRLEKNVIQLLNSIGCKV